MLQLLMIEPAMQTGLARSMFHGRDTAQVGPAAGVSACAHPAERRPR